MMLDLTIVIPCYNEENVLDETIKQLLKIINHLIAIRKISENSLIYFIDDGSHDTTWSMIEHYTDQHQLIRGIKLSRNCGHQNALLAGLLSAEGDAIISIDADLQDDPKALELMVDAYHQGYDIVYAVRATRDTDTFFKRVTAESYYKLLALLGVNVTFNHADFRLMSRRSIDALQQYGEINLFLRGIVPTIGYSSTSVTYYRNKRFAGSSKYPLHKMLALALDGITSFSAVPLRFIAILGFIVFFFSLIFSVWALWVRFVVGNAVPGWTSSVLPIYFIGGIQLMSIGVLGEYIGKIYIEVKKRPRYIIEKII